MKIAFFLCLITVICSCTTEHASVNGEKPPRYAREVQVALYDATPRSPTPRLDVIGSQDANGRPYRVIAMLTRGGYFRDEGLIMNAIAWRARQLGAEGLIPANINPDGSIWASRGRDEAVFRALAIVFSPPPEPTPKP